MIPTIKWDGEKIKMVDQRKIPFEIAWYYCRGYKDVIKAIQRMVIRGAPAIGVAAAMGLALGARSIKARSQDDFARKFDIIAQEMLLARPTAVNLRWAVERMQRVAETVAGRPADELKLCLRHESERILNEDIQINRTIGENGLDLVPNKATILTHCNAGALATGGYGTALGVIRAAHKTGGCAGQGE